MTKVEVHGYWFVLLPTMGGRGTDLISMVVASGNRPCINGTQKHRNLAHDFGVKRSSCMCSHVSCPGWRNVIL